MIEFTDISKFNEALQKETVVLADFLAQWCGPCRMLSSVLDEVSSVLDKVLIVKVNVDEAHEIASKYNIQSLPTLILFKKGKEIASRIGFISKSNLLQWIDKNIK